MDGRVFTKSHVPISHPGRDLQWLKCGKSSMFAACGQVPDDGGLANIIGDDKSSSASLAHVVHAYELDVIAMMCKSSFDCKGVVVQANYDRSLREKEERSGGSTGHEVIVGSPGFLFR